MKMIDNGGRLFGRFNLIDSIVVFFCLVMIPIAYGTFLLFRPATPRIDSVSPSIISKEERRISSGARLVAKFKVKGTGFNPLLRARIGDADALGFVFENPNSADVLVGPIFSGPHDLILFDGVHEVARAPGAITVKPGETTFIRAVGKLVDLDPNLVNELRVGLAFPEAAPAFKILALGPSERAVSRVNLAGRSADLSREGLLERDAVLTLRCDPSFEDNPCAMNDEPEAALSPVMLSLPGPTRYFGFALQEIFPDVAPRKARVQVRLGPDAPRALMRAGDRDDCLDERAAVIIAIGAGRVTLEMGLDDSREGWSYRSRLVKPGTMFVLSTEQYQAAGQVEAVTLLDTPARAKP